MWKICKIPLLATLFLIVLCPKDTTSAKILFFFGVSTYSHRITVWPLVEALVERGHNVTFFQPYENKSPNPKVTEMQPPLLMKELEGGLLPDFLQIRLQWGKWGVQTATIGLPLRGVALCEALLNDPEVIKWVDKSEFDLVFLDALFNDCGLGFAHKFKAKHATFGTTSVFGFWPDAYGFPMETSWVPEIHWSFPIPMAFHQRVVSTMAPLFFHYLKRWIMFPKLETMLREKLNMPDMPSIMDLEQNSSLVLMNTHFSEELGRSLPPLIVPIGGMHCKESNSKLPTEFEQFISKGNNPNGFIYVSFGSAVDLATASEELQDVFFNVLGRMNTRFLWKWEGVRPKKMPANVLTAKWMPQQDVLAHPKIRGFITHGGLLGMQEALYHGVPMISIPVFAEQDYNTERLHRTGRGIRLDIVGLTEIQLEDAINDLLTNDRYKKECQKASKRFRDRPAKPVETAVWWTEYVLRHDDLSHLRPVYGQAQFWFQRRLLDVWAFILIVILSLTLFNVWLIRMFWRMLFGAKKTSKDAPKTTKGKNFSGTGRSKSKSKHA